MTATQRWSERLHNLKKIIMGVFLIVAAGVASADPVVLNVTAVQRYPWNGKVDISCTASGISGSGWRFKVSAVMPGSGEVRRVSAVKKVQDGVETTDLSVSANGAYQLVWDAKASLGVVKYNNMVVRVEIESSGTDPHGKVRLWADGPYWATTNIGAENPEDYGYYFWWGDTIGYRRVNDAWVALDNFQFSDSSTPTYIKSTATLQSEGWITSGGVLAPEHDAAHVHWGGSWRMPTKDEFAALNNNCDWTWTTLNGVNGYEVRGKGDYASASIFLPAAGKGIGTSLYYAGSIGFYWSSVPHADYDYHAWSLDFNSSYHGTGYYERYNGQSVRAVQVSAE